MSLTTKQTWAYGGGDLGLSLLYVALNTHFFYFLVNVAEFSALEAGAVFIIGRVVDAFTDPLIGSKSDELRDSIGRVPFIKWALLPTAVAFVLLFALPLAPVAPVALAIVGVALYSVASTCVLMPYLAMLPELVPDYDARTTAIGIKSVFTMLATLIAFAVPPGVVLAIDGTGQLAETSGSAWVYMSALVAVVFIVPVLVTVAVVPDPRSVRTAGTEEAVATPMGRSIVASFRSAWQTRGMAEVVYLFLAVTVAIMITNSLLTFFLESVLRIPGEQLPAVLGALVLVSILAFPLWIALAKRIGKRRAFMVSAAVEIVSLLLLITIVPAGGFSAPLWTIIVLNGIAVGGITMFPWSMLPDIVELDELRVGQRREGLLYAVFTFSQKLATSIGVFANAIVIAVFGYVAGQVEQSPETLSALRGMMGPGASVVFALAIFFAWRYPVTREVHAEATAALRARHET